MASLKEIIEYSKANPNTDYAKKAYEHIQSGAFDTQAQQEGVDLSWAGRPKVAVPVVDKNSSNVGNIGGKPVVGGVVGSMIRPVVNLGKETAAAIGGNVGTKDLEQQNKALSDSDLNNIKTFQTIKQQQQAEGRDTSHIDNLLRNYKTTQGTSLAELYPALNDTNEEVIGNAIGTILAATSGGGLETGVSAVKTGLGQALKTGATVGGIYGGAGSIGTAMTENKSATDVLKEGATGAVIGAGIGAGTAGAAYGLSKLPEKFSSKAKFDKATELSKAPGQMNPEKATELAWQDIQPKQTAGTKRAYAESGNVTEQGLFKGAKLTPTEADKPVLDTIQKMYQDGTLKPGMSVKQKFNSFEQKASQLHGEQKGFLADNNKIVDPNIGLFDKLDVASKENTIPFSRDAAAKGAYDSAIDVFKKKLGDSPEVTLTKVDDALTKFDNEMDKFGAWEREATGELAEVDKARIQAIRDIHTTARDFIAEQLPPNNPWKAIRMEESNIYQAAKRLANGQLSGTIGNSKVVQFLQEHPMIRRGLYIAGGSAIAGLGLGGFSGGLGQSQ